MHAIDHKTIILVYYDGILASLRYDPVRGQYWHQMLVDQKSEETGSGWDCELWCTISVELVKKVQNDELVTYEDIYCADNAHFQCWDIRWKGKKVEETLRYEVKSMKEVDPDHLPERLDMAIK